MVAINAEILPLEVPKFVHARVSEDADSVRVPLVRLTEPQIAELTEDLRLNMVREARAQRRGESVLQPEKKPVFRSSKTVIEQALEEFVEAIDPSLDDDGVGFMEIDDEIGESDV